ncbi:GerMN domain-containing protein [Spelaeicoccus albus]|uniref:GerMN domain-containing protein n=1 Tax=Spelaeicoccus albus TaxID=1280376 RepID=A0A7Z0D4F5_9MICO|nr:GerMN domain-containing protein [Spelaeicoccus albus]NYI68685.1 hypothetical protein [Spelaeicoccus albus]
MPPVSGSPHARFWYLVIGAICVIVLSGATLVACTGPWGASQESTTPTPTPTTAGTVNSPVYFLGSDKNNDKLYREFRNAPSLDDPVATAVSAMTKLHPLDDSYQNFWRPARSVTSSLQDNTITVDISSDAFNSHPTKLQAKQSIQQLVYTATAAAAQAKLADGIVAVTILVDGKPNYSAWGDVKLGRAISRDADARSPVWLIDPGEGQIFTTGAVTINGNGASADGTLMWQVKNAAGKIVRREPIPVSTDPSNPTSFSFVIELPNGIYTASAFETDSEKTPNSTKMANVRYVDKKTFTIDKPSRKHGKKSAKKTPAQRHSHGGGIGTDPRDFRPGTPSD